MRHDAKRMRHNAKRMWYDAEIGVYIRGSCLYEVCMNNYSFLHSSVLHILCPLCIAIHQNVHICYIAHTLCMNMIHEYTHPTHDFSRAKNNQRSTLSIQTIAKRSAK